MCKQGSRFWFWASSRSGGRMVHIISARSIGKARLSFGRLFEEYIFTQVTWGDMNRLAGIIPPTVESDTTFAEGHLLYEHNGRVVSIEVAD